MELKIEPKTRHALMVELRNEVAGRIIAQTASARYWRIVADKSEKDTQGRIDALQKADINTKLIKADKLYLKVIDEMLEEQNG